MMTPQLVTLAVQQGSFPRMLYKYRQIDKYSKSIFEHRQLWFAHMDSFNDPFDCQIHDEGGDTTEDLMNYLTRAGMDKIEASSIVLRNAANPGFFETTLRDSKKTTLAKWGVLCLSRQRDDILMWSHYCASHTGFVLGFDVLTCPELFVVPLNVKYDANYPAYHYLREEDRIVTHGMATKSQQWSYEEEVRIVKSPVGAYSFTPECLKQIVFGCRMVESSKKELISYLRDFGFPHAEIWQASCSLTSFKLEIQRLA